MLAELWRRPGGAYGLLVVVLVFAAAVVSLLWTPYPLLQQDVADKWQGPSLDHWLGTDQIGRDTFSWLLAGARTTVFVSVLSAVIAGALGVVLGALGALTPRWVSEPLAVLVDILIAFPTLLIAMLFAASLGGSLWVVVAAVGIAGGVSIGRVVRPEIRIADRSDFVLAARAAGVRRARVIRRHVVPNVAPVVIVQISLIAAVAVLAEAGLSYLGYGAPAGTPSWGRSLAESQRFIGVQPAAVLWPGLTITLTVLGFSLLGDALREAVDPRLRRARAATDEDSPDRPPERRTAPVSVEVVS
ncbi:ABC transporter permease [Microbacterium sp.]|uniref:ABC transporter permease n=1 Tax=Microbacterium sp. TaxID=51671 RepID=UPI0039E232D1